MMMIKISGKEYEVAADRLTYAEVISLARTDSPQFAERPHDITYQRFVAAPDGDGFALVDRKLLPGGSVGLVEGMSITAFCDVDADVDGMHVKEPTP
jgi:hypothetical protein